MSAPDRRALVDRDHRAPSIRRQCALLGVARSGVYRPLRAANDNDLALMRRLDELFTAWPFLGSRRMTALLRAEGYPVNRKRVQRLMRQMGIAALGPKPKTTKPAPGHKIFPYLLRNLVIDRPNQVWAADITYLKGYADGHEAKQGIADWVTFYNHRRPHQALANRTPMAIWRDGITGALGEGAVDMTLRLDNAGALPTSPQPPQQPKVLVA